MASDDDDPMLTVAEVAELAGMSKLDVYRLVEDGRLPVRRVGESLRVPHSGVRAYLEALGRG